MSRVSPFYSAEPEIPLVYHDNAHCQDGKNIKPGNKRQGKGANRRRCEECEKLEKDGK
jgi:hypothetical protein